MNRIPLPVVKILLFLVLVGIAAAIIVYIPVSRELRFFITIILAAIVRFLYEFLLKLLSNKRNKVKV